MCKVHVKFCLSLIRAHQSGLSEVSSTAVSLCPPLFSPLHFTSPRFLCLLSFSFLLLSVFFLVSLCCGCGTSQAVSNGSQAHHIFMCSCLFLSSSLPSLSLPLPMLAPSLFLYSFSSSLPPAPIFSSAREREGVRVGKKERKRKKERVE